MKAIKASQSVFAFATMAGPDGAVARSLPSVASASSTAFLLAARLCAICAPTDG